VFFPWDLFLSDVPNKIVSAFLMFLCILNGPDKLSLKVVSWNFISGNVYLQYLCYRSCLCWAMWQAPGEFLHIARQCYCCSCHWVCIVNRCVLLVLDLVHLCLCKLQWYWNCSTECWGSTVNFQGFCKRISLIMELVNVILIIFNAFFLCTSPSLCLINAVFISV
jgi:hypothetical protein